MKNLNLFDLTIDEAKQHRNFKIVKNEIAYEAAREQLNIVFNSYDIIDNNFLQQFQSTGFDSRIWELYLLSVFHEQSFNIGRKHDRPDFELIKGDSKIFVEAVTSNTSFNSKSLDKLEVLKSINDDNHRDFIINLRNESTIKLAGALFNKLRKEYWKLDWVKNHPLVLAIEPFHHPLVHRLSDSNLTGYLYGFENSWFYDTDNNLVIDTHKIKEHTHNNKTIPSNFFEQPNSENISAVIFSNSGTIAKFNRMGKLNGFGNKNIRIYRSGQSYNSDPNASTPLEFEYFVGENGPIENWSQGISMFHNPNAKFPIDRTLFPEFLHGYFDKNGYYCFYPKFFPIMSETRILVPENLKR
ncbi:hypothetical protein AR438_10960 [Chryseobacterium aquaticum]|uniref:Glycosaminoglycan attachment protein n=1 Tax=Chryseobacterium aquaticum TaxID=452084 RepID=A0A0Q3HUA6_9FLAO|nr:hypothetical protein [Chryseobacterium aquaticum]KQK26093.1 hypothetical protein AR438_10960 [Chryseobacterium aquaticum]